MRYIIFNFSNRDSQTFAGKVAESQERLGRELSYEACEVNRKVTSSLTCSTIFIAPRGLTMGLKAQSRIAELRQKAGLTQAQLAVFVGVSTNTVQNWEKDDGLTQLEKYIKLCELLGCDLKDLIEYVSVEDNEENKSKRFSIEEIREIRQRWDTDTKDQPKNTLVTK